MVLQLFLCLFNHLVSHPAREQLAQELGHFFLDIVQDLLAVKELRAVEPSDRVA